MPVTRTLHSLWRLAALTALGCLTSLTVTPEPAPPSSASPVDTAAIRRQFEAKDAVIADLRRQVAALQAQIRKLKMASHAPSTRSLTRDASGRDARV